MNRPLLVPIVVATVLGCAVRAQESGSRFSARKGSAAITVGKNSQATAKPANAHAEVHLTADPEDPARLAVCMMVERAPGTGFASRSGVNTAVYVSHDGGGSWFRGIEDSVPPPTKDPADSSEHVSWDPTCEFGRGGMLYFAASIDEPDAGAARVRIRFYRSTDDGRTWETPLVLAPDMLDKSWLVVDTWPESPGVDRVYLTYTARREKTFGPDGKRLGYPLPIHLSTDNGGSFKPLVSIDPRSTQNRSLFQPHDGAVLPDGTLALAIVEHALIVSSDADSAGFYFGRPQPPRGFQAMGDTSLIMSVAADHSGGPFHGRLYATGSVRWRGRNHVYASRSDDGGRTWSAPTRVNDDLPLAYSRDDDPAGPQNDQPRITVNRDGVVGLSWYQRQEFGQGTAGMTPRFSASLDGGASWLPSVAVARDDSDPGQRQRQAVPIQPERHNRRDTVTGTVTLFGSSGGWVGHYAGLAAGPDGTFHAAWIDGRTGVSQVWTAPIRVRGKVARDSLLESLRDVTLEIGSTLDSVRYSRIGPATVRVSVTITLENTSADTLRAPLHLRIVRAGKGRVGPARDRREWLRPDLWDASHLLRGSGLAPGGKVTESIEFELKDLAPEVLAGHFSSFALEVQILAGGTRR